MLNNLKLDKNLRKKMVMPLVVFSFIVVAVAGILLYLKNNLYTVMKVPEFQLVDQNGRTFSNKDLLGKVYLVEFFYTSCPTICPVMNSNMKFIKKEIDDNDFAIVSISIDSEKDTPEVLKAHAEKIGATAPNWHFLSGDRSYIDRLADQFDIYVGDKEDEAENLNHSGMIALVDQEGNIRCRYNDVHMPILYYSGLNYEDPEGKIPKLTGKYHPDRAFLIEDIRKLLKN